MSETPSPLGSFELPSVAESLLQVLLVPATQAAGLNLWEALQAAGTVEARTPVRVDLRHVNAEAFSKHQRRQASNGVLRVPLGEAFLELVTAGSPAHPAHPFFSAETAKRLQRMDPKIFALQDEPGKWWIWRVLGQWGNAHFGSRVFSKTDADAWAHEVVRTLPDDALGNPDSLLGWIAALRLDLTETVGAMSAARPELWMAYRNQPGRPAHWVLQNARNGAVWQRFLESGQDPHASTKDGVPFWRAVFPESVLHQPEPGGLSEAIAAWAVAQHERGSATPAISAFLVDCVTARLKQRTAWLNQDVQERLAYVRERPVTWANQELPLDGRQQFARDPALAPGAPMLAPAWAHPLLHRQGARFPQWCPPWHAWVKGLKSDAGLREAIGSGLDLASWLLHRAPTNGPDPGLSDAETAAAFHHPDADRLVWLFVGAWFNEARQRDDLLGAYREARLAVALQEPEPHGRKRLRL